MHEIDSDSFLAETATAYEKGIWSEVLQVLARYAVSEHSGTMIRVATGSAATMIADDGCDAWLLAQFAEPAVIAVREGLLPGRTVWHAARLLVALSGSPVTLEPGEAAVIGSKTRFPGGFSDPVEMRLDDLAAEMLRSMRVPRWRVRRLSR